MYSFLLIIAIAVVYIWYIRRPKKKVTLAVAEQAIKNYYDGLLLFLQKMNFTEQRKIEVDKLMEKFYQTEKKYIRLRERFRHKSEQQQIEICVDWFNYVKLSASKIAHGSPLWFELYKTMDEFRETVKDDKSKHKIKGWIKDVENREIELEEIERRFDNLLKKQE